MRVPWVFNFLICMHGARNPCKMTSTRQTLCWIFILVCTAIASGDAGRQNNNHKDQPLHEFVEFVLHYHKSYSAAEIPTRYAIFRANRDLVAAHNRNNHTWTMRLNEMADLNADEFATLYLGPGLVHAAHPVQIVPQPPAPLRQGDSLDLADTRRGDSGQEPGQVPCACLVWPFYREPALRVLV